LRLGRDVQIAWHDRSVSWPPQIGELLPHAEDAWGVREKLSSYSLDLDHRDGGHKARVFRAVLGITAADVDYLTTALRAGLATTPARLIRANPPHGVMCGVWITVRGPGPHADRTAVVRTAWEIRHEDDAPRLVTAYIEA
jgi:hypothetical protein